MREKVDRLTVVSRTVEDAQLKEITNDNLTKWEGLFKRYTETKKRYLKVRSNPKTGHTYRLLNADFILEQNASLTKCLQEQRKRDKEAREKEQDNESDDDDIDEIGETPKRPALKRLRTAKSKPVLKRAGARKSAPPAAAPLKKPKRSRSLVVDDNEA
jgi:hypothetical protein